VNVFKGEADFQRNYHAALLKQIIDESIREEVAKEPPNGWKTKPYHPSQWDKYWNHMIFYNGSGEVHKAYRGPSPAERVRYIISSREEAGLRRLPIEPRNKKIVEQAVAPQSATRSESDLEGGYKPQPDSKARPR
jgi:hypothetical protein